MEANIYTQRITIITLIAILLGIITICLHSAAVILMIALIAYIKTFRPVASHSWIQVSKFSITCFIFGIIDGYSLESIIEYINSSGNVVPTLQIFLFLLTVYHYFQFQMVNNFHHVQLKWDSFLIYHSLTYTIVQAFMFTEHFLTKYYLSLQYKDYHAFMWIALSIAVLGQIIRIIAFFTCRHNFTHLVRYHKNQGHTLVTNGIYSFLRHPAYTGYFYFASFSQVFLGNFVSAILFFCFLVKFFDSRIDDEEKALNSFFVEYKSYQKKTYILIPFVRTPDLQQKRWE